MFPNSTEYGKSQRRCYCCESVRWLACCGTQLVSSRHNRHLFASELPYYFDRSLARKVFDSEDSDDSLGSEFGGVDGRDGRGDEEYQVEGGGYSRRDRSRKSNRGSRVRKQEIDRNDNAVIVTVAVMLKLMLKVLETVLR